MLITALSIEFKYLLKIYLKQNTNIVSISPKTLFLKNWTIKKPYVITDMLSNKELNPIVTELFIREREN